jgi:hypothetical protein
MNESDMETAIYVLTIVVVFLLWLFYKRQPPVMAPPPGVAPGGATSVSVSNISGAVPGRCNCG